MNRIWLLAVLVLAACSKSDADSNSQMPKEVPRGFLVDEAKPDPNGLIPLSELQRVQESLPVPKSGLWEVVAEVRSGPNAEPRITTKTKCLSEKDLSAARKVTPSSLGACSVARMARSGDALTVEMTCPDPNGQPTTMRQDTTFAPEKSVSTVVSQSLDGTARFIKLKSTRVGDCLN